MDNNSICFNSRDEFNDFLNLMIFLKIVLKTNIVSIDNPINIRIEVLSSNDELLKADYLDGECPKAWIYSDIRQFKVVF